MLVVREIIFNLHPSAIHILPSPDANSLCGEVILYNVDKVQKLLGWVETEAVLDRIKNGENQFCSDCFKAASANFMTLGKSGEQA